MKALAFIIFAAIPFSFWNKPTTGGGGPTPGNITADVWVGFETATPDSAGLKGASSGSGVSAAAFAVFGTGLTSTSAERNTFSTVNSTADSGTLGWQSNHNTDPNFQIDLNSYPTVESVGFNYQCTSLTSGSFTIPYAVGEGASTGSAIARIRVDNTAGVYTMTLETNAGVAGSSITISAATWYWVTAKFDSAGTCSLSVYTTGGVQVGSTVTEAGQAKNFFYHFITCASSSAAGDDYFDDLVIDKTSAAFPLGP